jgi:hypothetical protein
MKWVTRERPKIDRIACPWLVPCFIDRTPEFLFVPRRFFSSVRYRNWPRCIHMKRGGYRNGPRE